jgi:hypothetical protein
MIYTKLYTLPPTFNKKEILRYAGIFKRVETLEKDLDMCLEICKNSFSGKVCYIKVPVKISGDVVDISFASPKSKNLAKNLSGCDEAVVFASTVGIEIDRLIKRYEKADMSKAVWLQAIGAERIETLCNMFCKDIENEEIKNGKFTKPRFSAGYGDLDLSLQKDIFRALNCSKLIGISLAESLIMSPSKSVTAIMGLSKSECTPSEDCEYCEKENCRFRKEKI